MKNEKIYLVNVRNLMISEHSKNLMIFLVLALFLIQSVSAAGSASYDINDSVISSGGTNISGGSYSTDLAVTQTAAGNASSSNYQGYFGFFYAIQNNVPVCSSIPDQTWNQDTVKIINLSAYVSDDDSDILSYSNISVSSIQVSTDQNTGLVTLIPDAGFSGTRTIVFSVNDSADATDCNNITLTVSAVTPVPTPVTAGGGGAITHVTDFSIDKDLFHVKLVQGKTQRETLIVQNTGNTDLSFIVDTDDLKQFVIANEYAFELKAQEGRALKFDFFASEKEIPDVYTGRILIRGDGIEKPINTIIDVISKEALFDVSVSIFPEDKIIEEGKSLRANISLINLGDLRGVDVEVEYIIKDMNGKVINKQHETIGVLGEKLSFVKSFDTKKLKAGDYVVYVRLTFKGAVATSSELFTVKEVKKPFNWIYLLPLVIIMLLIITILLSKYLKKQRHKHRHRRMHRIVHKIIKRAKKRRR